MWKKTRERKSDRTTKSGLIDEIEELKRKIAELQEAEYLLRIQRDMTLHLSGIERLTDVLRLCLETAMRVSGMDSGGIYVAEEGTGEWLLAVHSGLPAAFIAQSSRYDADSPNVRAMISGLPLYSNYQTGAIEDLTTGRKSDGLRAFAAIPIPHRDSIIACLNVSSHDLEEVPPAARMSLETIAGQMGQSIVRARYEEALRRSEKRFQTLADSLDVGIYRSVPEDGGRFTESNQAHIKMLGYASFEELRGLRIVELYESSDDRGALLGTLEALGFVRHREIRLRRRNGDVFTASISAVALRDADGKLAAIDGIVEDVSERKKAEEALRAALREKEVLIREIHHRVKNNMQVIISLLRLQARTIPDPERREVFAVTQDRIRSMALVHEKLYHSLDLAGIDFKGYIQSLVVHLGNSVGPSLSACVRVDLQLDDIELNINKAVPCGLILNELITNAYKYAFPGARGGTVRITLEAPSPGAVRLTVADDGVGLPAAIDPLKPETLGLQIVSDLVRQIDAQIVIERSGGTSYTLSF